jgi:hypothetical protein
MFPACRSGKLTGTHQGEYCGLQASGRRVSIALISFFLFDKTTGHLNAERIYFDNNTILAQIKGEISPDDVFDLSRIEQAAPDATNSM